MKIKTIIGATHDYACIESPGHSLDVQLNPGRSAAQSLRESAAEIDAKIERLARQAATMREAADILESKNGN